MSTATDLLVAHGIFLLIILTVGLLTAIFGAIRDLVIWLSEPRETPAFEVEPKVPVLSQRARRAQRAASRAVEVVTAGRGRTIASRVIKTIPLDVPPASPVVPEVIGLTIREERRLEAHQ